VTDLPGPGECFEGGSVTRLGRCRAPRTRSEPEPRNRPQLDRAEGPGRSDRVAIPLRSESAPASAALGDGDQLPSVELYERDPGVAAPVREAERAMVAAGGGGKGKRVEYRCAGCGYGIVVYGRAPSCPTCSGVRWHHVEWRPFSRSRDGLAVPFATRSLRRRLHASSSLTIEEPIRSLRRAGASLER
jgi:hypothetical protein